MTQRYPNNEQRGDQHIDTQPDDRTMLIEELKKLLQYEAEIVIFFNRLGEASPAAFSLECERARALLRELGDGS